MAATPDEFLRAGDFLADAEPFSPSLFLDLPPTPSPPRAAPASDDLDLDFISRMLMEEDMDDKFFYQYPDHPAILSAQHRLAQVISGSNTAPSTDDSANTTVASSTFSSDSATGRSASSCSDSATNTGKSTCSFHSTTNTAHSTSCSSSPGGLAPANPTWPYDRIYLSQPLHSPPYNANNLFFSGVGTPTAGYFGHTPALSKGNNDYFLAPAGQNGRSTGMQSFAALSNSSAAKDAKTLSNNGGSCRGGPCTPASAFFNGQTDGDVDMLNMAFRKGMEEANKFLPTTNTLDAISNKPVLRDLTGDQLKKEEVDRLRMSMFSNGRGRKNRHGAEDLEAEVGRRSKLMMPEQEDTGVGEMVEEIMLHGHEIIMKGIEDLHIAMDTEAEKNHRKGASKAARGRRGASEVVDLRTMLIHCAQAVATGDRRGSNELLKQIKQHSSAKGDATQRLAYCFAEGLEARLAGTGSHVYQSLMAKSTSVGEFLRAYKLYMAASSFRKVNFIFVGKIIMDAMVGKSRLHIVDYNVQYGFQWPGLLQMLAEREGGPPDVRITGIDLPQPGFRPAFQIEETGRRLSKCAREFGVPFKYHGIPAKFETVHAEDLNIDPDEVLIVTSQSGFSNLMDESVIMDRQDIPSPRDMVLSNIRKMRPDVFIDCVVNGTYGAPFFVTRFREALFSYSAQFDMLDATIPRDNDDRLLIERDIFGPCALNVIACEGADRVDRPETYKQWQVRGHRAGLRQVPLSPAVVKLVRDKVKTLYHKDFLIDVDNRWLLQGWKGQVLYAMSTWVAADHDYSKF
ncbi:scarecrow-like protein 34 [Hordeum vulgare]|nr:scarecrow-like protein 34 [Hordeum vulgare]